MTAFALAWRDLRGGIGSLWLLLACLTIAVAGVASVTSVASAIGSSIEKNGRELLGADLVLSVAQRTATLEERAAMARLGRVSESVTLRSNLIASGGSALVELSGVDRGWPPAGRVALAGGRVPVDGEAAVGREVAERLGLRIGLPVRIGFATFRVSGIIEELPSVAGFAFAPPVLVTRRGLAETALVQPGSLYTASYRLILPDGADGRSVGKSFQQAFPAGGWRALDKADAGMGTRRFVDRVGQLLLLIALGALGIGSIGIASAAGAFAVSRRQQVAILKIHGASRAQVGRIMGLAVTLIAVVSIVIGLAAGAAAPALAGAAIGDMLPIAPDPRPQWEALLLSAAFGALVTLAAAWRPIARAANDRPAAALREDVADREPGSRLRRWSVPLVALVLLASLALWTASDRMLAGIAFGAAAFLAAVFGALGAGLARLGTRLSKTARNPVWRLGLSALGRLGAATVRLSIALGLGLSLLVALAAIGSSLSAQLRETIPQRAPTLFLLDIPAAEEARFRKLASQFSPGAEVRLVPSLRGPVTALNGRPVSTLTSIPEGAWVLRGDRGLTFADAVPAGNRVVSGRWWAQGYRGPPLISLDVEAARALGLKVGDRMTVAVLGRPIEARIANLREIDWRSFGFNFAIIFAPGTLEAAPYTLMATIALPPGTPTAKLERALTRDLPMVSTVRVAEIIDRVAQLLRSMDAAIRLATGFAILIGVAVLAGAVTASQAVRRRESVLLKLVGATRRQVLVVQLIEFMAMSGAIAVLAFFLGAAAGWAVVTQQFALPFEPDWPSLLLLPAAGVILATLVALAAAWPSLSARPAEALRAL